VFLSRYNRRSSRDEGYSQESEKISVEHLMLLPKVVDAAVGNKTRSGSSFLSIAFGCLLSDMRASYVR
jgi:hypothetical protein